MAPVQQADLAGTPIEVGAKVAYNLSGSVWRGEVIEISSTFRILPDRDMARSRASLSRNPSRVRHANSILVLERP